LLSILLVPLFGAPLFVASRLGGWASSSFSSLHPKDSGVLVTFDDTLVFNDCIMEWVNIPSTGIWGGIKCNRLGKWGTVKRFLFFAFS
jgi:hypothetical protein